jgi:hypothetical protein
MKYLLALLLLCQPLFSRLVTYEVPSGRFGDQLIVYMHAKWISYRYQMPLLFKPFLYSQDLILDQEESVRKAPNYPLIPIENDDTIPQTELEQALFMAQYFPESPYDYKHYKWPTFSIDWNDPGFLCLLRTLIAPKTPFTFSELPTGRTSVALHVRTGVGFDDPILMPHWPLKFPNESFYLDQLKTLCTLLENPPLFVHLFTDDPDPSAIIERYKTALSDLDIEFAFRREDNRPNAHVLEDLFDMMRYDCLIRPESSYSIVAEKLGNFQLIIHPLDCTFQGKNPIITPRIIQKRSS